MSAVVSFPDGTHWFINGWGWRTLMERAVQKARDEPEAAEFTDSLHNNGLMFETLDEDFAVRTATSLRGVAVELRREFGTGSEYEREYAARLQELISGLDKVSGNGDRDGT